MLTHGVGFEQKSWKSGVLHGWAQGSFVEAEAESSRQRRGRLNSRQGRGEATPEKTLLPLDV